MSLDVPSAVINIIPPTPDASAIACTSAISDPPDTAVATVATPVPAAAADDDDDNDDYDNEDDEMIQSVVAEDRIDLTSEWLRRHVDIFTHLREGLIDA